MKTSYKNFQTGLVIKMNNGIIKVNGVIVGEYNTKIPEYELNAILFNIIKTYK